MDVKISNISGLSSSGQVESLLHGLTHHAIMLFSFICSAFQWLLCVFFIALSLEISYTYHFLNTFHACLDIGSYSKLTRGTVASENLSSH
jgi:hypothetical protein